METVIIKYGLADYSKWKLVFDDLTSFGCACGLIGNNVFLDPANRHTVVAVNRFRNLDSAKNFIQSQEFLKAVQKAEVVKEAEILLYHNNEKITIDPIVLNN